MSREKLLAELERVSNVAGEALGTDPELRSPACVDALAEWNRSLRSENEALRKRVAECDAEHPPEEAYVEWCEAGKPDVAALRTKLEEEAYHRARAEERAEKAEARVQAFEDELSKEMPSDMKDWWQNSKEEWPEVARLVLEMRRKGLDDAWGLTKAALDRAENAEASLESWKSSNLYPQSYREAVERAEKAEASLASYQASAHNYVLKHQEVAKLQADLDAALLILGSGEVCLEQEAEYVGETLAAACVRVKALLAEREARNG